MPQGWPNRKCRHQNPGNIEVRRRRGILKTPDGGEGPPRVPKQKIVRTIVNKNACMVPHAKAAGWAALAADGGPTASTYGSVDLNDDWRHPVLVRENPEVFHTARVRQRSVYPHAEPTVERDLARRARRPVR